MGCILKVELTGLADELDVRESIAKDDFKSGCLEKQSPHFQNGQKYGRRVFNGETRSLVLDLIGLKCHIDIQEEMSGKLVDKSLDFRKRSRLELYI